MLNYQRVYTNHSTNGLYYSHGFPPLLGRIFMGTSKAQKTSLRSRHKSSCGSENVETQSPIESKVDPIYILYILIYIYQITLDVNIDLYSHVICVLLCVVSNCTCCCLQFASQSYGYQIWKTCEARCRWSWRQAPLRVKIWCCDNSIPYPLVI